MCFGEICLEPNLLTILQCIAPIFSIAGVLISALALIAAIYIPRKIMINQIYADLLTSYRSYEMGEAILAIFHFYTDDCKKDVSKIAELYEDKYKKQIESKLKAKDNKEKEELNFSNTLHFQRRLVAQFYFNMASLRYDYRIGRLSKKKMETWFRPGDINMLGLLLHMAEPARKLSIDAGEVPQPYEDEVPMNKLIYKLYEEVREMK